MNLPEIKRKKMYAVVHKSVYSMPKGKEEMMIFSESLPAYIFAKEQTKKKNFIRLFTADFLESHIQKGRISGMWKYREHKNLFSNIKIL